MTRLPIAVGDKLRIMVSRRIQANGLREEASPARWNVAESKGIVYWRPFWNVYVLKAEIAFKGR